MTNKIKLTFDASATPISLTGAGYYVVEIIKQLDSRNDIELTVITRSSDLDRFSELAPNSKILNVAPDSLAQRLLFQNLKLNKVVDELNSDLFHGPHYQLPKKIKTPSTVTIHDMTLLTHKDVHKKIKTIYFSKIIPAAIKQASSIISVSQSTKDDIIKMFNPSKEIFVGQLGFNSTRFNLNVKDDIELLRTRGIEGQFIGYLGLLEPRKRVPDLINAFSKIAKDYTDLHLVIAGAQGWGVEQIREAVRQSGCSTRIILPGRLSDEEVSAFYRQTACFVYPSIYEGFGMPVLEAMACGAPVITTNSSSLSEVAGDAAVLVSPDSPNEIEAALRKVLDDSEHRNSLVNKSIARANNFSWENCAEEHIKAYRAAL